MIVLLFLCHYDTYDFLRDLVLNLGFLFETHTVHGDAGANTDDAGGGDNMDDPGAVTRGGPCYDPSVNE